DIVLRDAPARLPRTAQTLVSLVQHRAAPLLLLGLFADHAFIDIADALALVRLGRPDRTHLGGDLPDHLAVGALDDDLGRRRRLHLDAGRHVLHHRMREADLQVQLRPLRLRAEADADQGQPLLEALADAG